MMGYHENPGAEQTRQEIKDVLGDMIKKTLVQEDILGHPQPWIFIPMVLFLLIALFIAYKAYTLQVLLGSLVVIPYLISISLIIGVFYALHLSTGYRILITPKKLVVYHKGKEIFSAPHSDVNFKYLPSFGYTKLVLTSKSERGEEQNLQIISWQFKELDKVIERLKKIRSMYSKK